MKKYLFSIVILAFSLSLQAQVLPLTHSVSLESFTAGTTGISATFSNPVRVNMDRNYLVVNTDREFIQMITDKGSTYYTFNNLTSVGETITYHSPGNNLILNTNWVFRSLNNETETYFIHDNREGTRNTESGIRKMGQNEVWNSSNSYRNR